MGILPIERRNSRWWHKTNAALRLAVLRGATRPFARNVIVNEYPKSGGSWLSQMLSEALDLPFPRNRLPMIGSCLMQCHILNPTGMRNVVVVWRDGRDVMVSFYHHLLLGHEFSTADAAQAICQSIGVSNPENVRENLPRFINALMQGQIGPSFAWPDFVDVWHERADVTEVRYEDLLNGPKAELSRLVLQLTGKELSADKCNGIVEKYSFKSQSGRTQGQEAKGQFLRKGISGDWKNHFSPEAEAAFEKFAGNQLRKLGYA